MKVAPTAKSPRRGRALDAAAIASSKTEPAYFMPLVPDVRQSSRRR